VFTQIGHFVTSSLRREIGSGGWTWRYRTKKLYTHSVKRLHRTIYDFVTYWNQFFSSIFLLNDSLATVKKHEYKLVLWFTSLHSITSTGNGRTQHNIRVHTFDIIIWLYHKNIQSMFKPQNLGPWSNNASSLFLDHQVQLMLTCWNQFLLLLLEQQNHSIDNTAQKIFY